MIIVCGADNTGKSTLVEKLTKEFKLPTMERFPKLPPQGDEEYKEYFNWVMKITDLKLAVTGKTVIDRFAIGEFVYGPIVRGVNHFKNNDEELVQAIASMKPLLIVCGTSMERITQTYGDRVQYAKLEVIPEVMTKYKEVAKNWSRLEGISVVYHDYMLDPSYQIIFNKVKSYLKDMTKYIKEEDKLYQVKSNVYKSTKAYEFQYKGNDEFIQLDQLKTELDTLKNELIEKEKEIEDLRTQLLEREEVVTLSEKELSKKEKKVEQLATEAQEKLDNTREMEAKAIEKELELIEREKEVKEKEEKVKEK